MDLRPRLPDELHRRPRAVAEDNGKSPDAEIVDGNKRLGWTSAVVFLELNGETLDAAEAIVTSVTTGELDDNPANVPHLCAASPNPASPHSQASHQPWRR
ncbi:hypothetical protein [Nonomuraea aurantiaca]|jgi:hypothetical protein|uniref:hypothetical protein n=1 Tax=Nonomuraea aurantiaca TaxID=2878562 RepID=UPI001CD92683|nr:hypothetical protein [Nonomuraea aurantiaca]MCA2219644.1 hypothetical protein [Nonomuraea aurantiaca]